MCYQAPSFDILRKWARLMLSFSSLFFHLIFVVFIAFFPICSVSVVETKLWYCSKEKEFLFLGCLLLTSTSKLRRDVVTSQTPCRSNLWNGSWTLSSRTSPSPPSSMKWLIQFCKTKIKILQANLNVQLKLKNYSTSYPSMRSGKKLRRRASLVLQSILRQAVKTAVLSASTWPFCLTDDWFKESMILAWQEHSFFSPNYG